MNNKDVVMSPEEAFDLGQKSYEKLEKVIEEMISVMKGNDCGIDLLSIMSGVDVALQSILLKSALVDNEITVTEIAFIQAITSYGDMLAGVNASFKESMDYEEIKWADLAYCSPEMANILITHIDSFIMPSLIETIMKILGVIDSNSYKNYLLEIKNIMFDIAIAFSLVDGDSIKGDNAKKELLKFFEEFDKVIKDNWGKGLI